MTWVLDTGAELSNLGIIRRFVREKAALINLSEEATDDLVLAVNEAVTNTIVHGYKEQGGQIQIVFREEAGDVVVSIRDESPPFDPTTVPPPDFTLPLEKCPTGGMGVYLCNDLTDSMSYRRTPDGFNELILIKNKVHER